MDSTIVCDVSYDYSSSVLYLLCGICCKTIIQDQLLLMFSWVYTKIEVMLHKCDFSQLCAFFKNIWISFGMLPFTRKAQNEFVLRAEYFASNSTCFLIIPNIFASQSMLCFRLAVILST